MSIPNPICWNFLEDLADSNLTLRATAVSEKQGSKVSISSISVHGCTEIYCSSYQRIGIVLQYQ